MGAILFPLGNKAQTSLMLPFANSQTQGQRVIHQVVLEGNKKTRDYIILRELDIHPGDTLPSKILDSLLILNKYRIFNTQLFNSVDLSLHPIDSLRSNLRVKVTERWYLFPIPIVELADRNFNEWWYDRGRDLSRINYGIKFTHRNFRGRAEILRAMVQLGFTRRLEFVYDLPYIDKKLKNGIGFSAIYQENNDLAFRSGTIRPGTEQDTIFNRLEFTKGTSPLRTRFELAANYTRRSNFYGFHTAELGYRINTIDKQVALLNPDYFLDTTTVQSYFYLNYNFTYDKRDVQAYPLKGTYFSIGATQYGLLPQDAVKLFSMGIQGSFYHPLGNKFYTSASLQGKASFPKRQPYSLFRSLGYGLTYIRGYERYVIDGNHFVLSKLTLSREVLSFKKSFHKIIPMPQFQVIPISLYLKTYYDAGYVWDFSQNPFNARLANRLVKGYGVGLDIVTFYNLVLGFDYSRNDLQQNNFFFRFVRDI
jgi:outer membrane protein assembly factor BamA